MISNRGRLVKPLVHIPQQHFANWKHRSCASESTQAATGAVGVIDFSVERKPINIAPKVSDESSALSNAYCPALSVSPCSSSSSEEFFPPSPVQTGLSTSPETVGSNGLQFGLLPRGMDVPTTQQLNAPYHLTDKKPSPCPPRPISREPLPTTNYWFHELETNPAFAVPVQNDIFTPSNMKEPHPFSGLPIEIRSNQGQPWDDPFLERSYTGAVNEFAHEAAGGWWNGTCCADDFTGAMATPNLYPGSSSKDFLWSPPYSKAPSPIPPEHIRGLYSMWPNLTAEPRNVDVSSNLPLEPPAQSAIYPYLYPNPYAF